MRKTLNLFFRGSLKEGGNQVASELMEIQLDVLPQQECKSRLLDFAPDYDTKQMICAYGGDKDACQVKL